MPSTDCAFPELASDLTITDAIDVSVATSHLSVGKVVDGDKVIHLVSEPTLGGTRHMSEITTVVGGRR